VSHCLVLFIDDTWPAKPALPWALLDTHRRLIEEGHSEPRHWPTATELDVVLSSTMVSWPWVMLPKGKSRDEARLLTYALEEHIVGDPDSQHVTPTRYTPQAQGQRCAVLVMAKARLRALLAQLEALGRIPSRLVAAPECVTANAQDWVLVCEPGGALFIRHDEQGFLPASRETVRVLLEHLIENARKAHLPARACDSLIASGQRHPDDMPDLELPMPKGSPWAWWQIPPLAHNLLHGELAPLARRGGFRQALGWPLGLAATALLTLFVVSLGEVMFKRADLADHENRMRRLFETTLPPGTPVIDPARQLTRALDALRARQGELRESDFMSLLLAGLQALGTDAPHSVLGARYARGPQGGQLRLQFSSDTPIHPEALKARLAAQGLALSLDGQTGEWVLQSGVQP
jgi:general secretion pathway protein L